MKRIYVAHSSNFDFQKELYRPLRQSELNDKYELFLPHETSDQLFDSKGLFASGCDFVLAEVSYPSTGMGIELGWANLYNIPIICAYRRGCEPSTSLSSVAHRFFEYANLLELVEHLVWVCGL